MERKGLRTPEAQFGAKRTAYSRGAIRGEEDCVLPRRNSERRGLRTPEAQFGRGAIRVPKNMRKNVKI
ncbi:hypothetical protein FXV91_07390 [Methanosarcina sp. DH2]|nr:hypothetical protein [Methanosarcina sp. DH2]